MTDPLGRSTSYTYDTVGQRAAMTDSLGSNWAWSYDGAGRVTSETVADGGTYSYIYDPAGNMTSSGDPLGRSTSYGYDPMKRRTSMTQPGGGTATWTYDTAGQLSSTTSAAGYVSSFAYDSRGLPTQASDGLGNTTFSSYDAVGRLTSRTDPNGGTYGFTYDPMGRLTSETDPLGGSIQFSYDAAGQRTGFTNPNGNSRSWSYDAGGRVTFQADELGRITSYSYDPVGRQLSMTDPRGITTNRVFDAAGQLVSEIAGGESRSFAYDSGGRVTSFSDITGTTAFTAFGEPRSGVIDTFGFAGEQTDPTGLVHLRARAYNPGLGGFTAYDPVQPGAPSTTGWNHFAYSGNNPTNWTDPTGQTTGESGLLSRALPVAAGAAALALGLTIKATLYLLVFCLVACIPGYFIFGNGGQPGLSTIRQELTERDNNWWSIGEDYLSDEDYEYNNDLRSIGEGPIEAGDEVDVDTKLRNNEDCAGDAARDRGQLAERAWKARPDDRKNVAAAVWCVEIVGSNREYYGYLLRTSSGSQHSEEHILFIFDHIFGAATQLDGEFYLHTNLSPCTSRKEDGGTPCASRLHRFEQAHGEGFQVACTYFYVHRDETPAYRQSYDPGSSEPRTAEC